MTPYIKILRPARSKTKPEGVTSVVITCEEQEGSPQERFRVTLSSLEAGTYWVDGEERELDLGTVVQVPFYATDTLITQNIKGNIPRGIKEGCVVIGYL